jgi:uncharacterized protein (DUF1810 family)
MQEFDLERYVKAQAPTYDQVVRELTIGTKSTHWMWYIFPQILGLGTSEMSKHYAIVSAAEAGKYLAHPVLGRRLRECTTLVNSHAGRSLDAIFGPVDAMKFHSSMTLFVQVSDEGSPFLEALATFCDSQLDSKTYAILQKG